jgi:hypothetical protein
MTRRAIPAVAVSGLQDTLAALVMIEPEPIAPQRSPAMRACREPLDDLLGWSGGRAP